MCCGRGLNSLSCAPYAKKKWEQFRLAVILWHETLNALFWHTIEWTRNSKSLNSNKFSASISHNQPKELSRAQSGLCSQAFPGWVLLAIMRRIKARTLMLALLLPFPLRPQVLVWFLKPASWRAAFANINTVHNRPRATIVCGAS